MTAPIRKLLVANRSEIAIRVFRAAAELGIRTVAIYAKEDRFSLHRSKADEAYPVGRGRGPREAYLAIDDIVQVALAAGVDAIHPGYGFLSENPEFAAACARAGIRFIGPAPETLRLLGDKVAARALAARVGVPVVPATEAIPQDPDEADRWAARVGYPLMVKAAWGGGGRGMRIVRQPSDLAAAVASARREAAAAFGRDDLYFERLVERARHVEVQVLGDLHGNLVHLFERDCTVQRRHQKVIERAPAPFLDGATRARLTEAALAIARAARYVGAGTVEFLMDAETGEIFFIEVNPRIQVEHTVTEEVTGLDIVKAQIRIAEGGRLGVVAETGIPPQEEIRLFGHAIQARVTTEDPERGFAPDYGRISAFRSASGFGIRIDGGTTYPGAVVTPFYDPLLEKVTAWAPTAEEAIARLDRALNEYRVRGVATNLAFLSAVLAHPAFRTATYTTRFVDETPELLRPPARRDRASKLLRYIAEVTVNGHPEMRGRTPVPTHWRAPTPPGFPAPPPGTKALLDRLGPEGLARWMREQTRVLVTDTSLRDAHQSLLATRMRTHDLVPMAEATARGLPGLFSLECWGGATFDVALRFLKEDPWERLARLRAAVPNLLLQMLLRGASAVGYANYPDNAVRFFVREAAAAGIDVFRIFDCFNDVAHLRPAIEAVRDAGKLAEAALCYAGDLTDPTRTRYPLSHYTERAKALEAAGAHVLAIKDMAGLLKPAAARLLVRALRDVTGLPIHLHTHDTSGIAAATLLAAVEEGVDAIDLALDSMSGTVSQPCLGSVVHALRHGPRDTGLDPAAIRALAAAWEGVRRLYAPFEGDVRWGASEVWLHEMPGGQFTNLREQARALGLEDRWPEVARAYRAANDLFGDIIKVTPSSKVVGDMALMMVSQNLSADDVLDPAREIAWPASVIGMLKGELGFPEGGFPPAVVAKALGPEAGHPPPALAPVDLEAARAEAQGKLGRAVSDRELASYLMHPEVFVDYARHDARFGPVEALPTPVFFGGMRPGEECQVELEPGKSLIVVLQAIGEPDPDGQVRLFFELNGQPRLVRVADRRRAARPARRKAEDRDGHVAAPMAGAVSSVAVRVGQRVEAGDPLLTLEAMKMETTLRAPRGGVVTELLVHPHDQVEEKDLLAVLGPVAPA